MLKIFEEKFNRKDIEEFRFIKSLNSIYILSAIIHLVFLFIFIETRVIELIIFNCFSPFLYLICYYYNKKKKATLAASLGMFEASVHGFTCTFFLGWESGFFYYVLLVFLLIFFLFSLPLIVKIFIALPVTSAFVFLFIYTHNNIPPYLLDPLTLVNFHIFNLILTILVISCFALLYSFFVRSIENELRNTITEMQIVQENYEMKIEENLRIQRMLTREKALLDALLNNIPDYIYFKDKQSHFIRVSKSLAQKFKAVSPDYMIGKTDFDYHSAENAQKFYNDEQQIINTGEPLLNDIVHEIMPHNISEWVSTTKMLLIDASGKCIGTFGISQNITELIRLQLEAKGQAVEIKIREEELKIKEEEQRLLNQQKNKFFSIFSHDLKNPLNSLQGFTELLWMNYDKFDEEKKRRLFGEIVKLVDNIKNLILNLLEWSRSQMNNLTIYPENIVLFPIIEDTIKLNEQQQQIKHIGIEVDVNIDQKVFADQHIVYTVIRNVYNNALKYSNANDVIRIWTEQDNGVVKLHISDTGIGMNEDEVSQLFVLGGISRPGTLKEKGTGLGLLVCKEYLEKCKGNIEVVSTPNMGSTFTIILPTEN